MLSGWGNGLEKGFRTPTGREIYRGFTVLGSSEFKLPPLVYETIFELSKTSWPPLPIAGLQPEARSATGGIPGLRIQITG